MTVPILIATLRGADYMNFDMGKIYMMITVAIVPIIIVYLLLSKYIIAGVTLGGVSNKRQKNPEQPLGANPLSMQENAMAVSLYHD